MSNNISTSNNKFFVLSEESSVEEIQNALRADLTAGRVGGFVPVGDETGVVTGVITDSDLRKMTNKLNKDSLVARDIMNRDFIYARSGASPLEIAKSILSDLNRREITNNFPITYIPVLFENNVLKSIAHISEVLPILENLNREIIIIGQGFVGLTFSMALVNSGIKIYAIEKSTETYNKIVAGIPSVYEPQLSEILERNLHKNYRITNKDLSEFKRKPMFCKRIYVIAVGTPHEDTKTDLSQIKSAVKILSKNIEFGDLIILRSTVPVGTTRNLVSKAIFTETGLQAGIDYHLAYAPERTVEGNAIFETRKLPQLISGLTPECTKAAINFFSEFVGSVVPCESLEACELAKLISNAYRDVVFGFANEVAQIASGHNIDVNKLISDANTGYSRNAIPQPSPGVGGPCLTKDTYMIEGLKEPSVMLSARSLNRGMEEYSADLIKRTAEIYGNKILVIGLAFKGKPTTNDLRNSPSVEIVKKLVKAGFEVQVIDAVASNLEIVRNGITPYESEKEPRFNPRLIAVLNDNDLNPDIFRNFIKNLDDHIDRSLFDPWCMINDSDLPISFTLRFNLSKHFLFPRHK